MKLYWWVEQLKWFASTKCREEGHHPTQQATTCSTPANHLSGLIRLLRSIRDVNGSDGVSRALCWPFDKSRPPPLALGYTFSGSLPRYDPSALSGHAVPWEVSGVWRSRHWRLMWCRQLQVKCEHVVSSSEQNWNRLTSLNSTEKGNILSAFLCACNRTKNLALRTYLYHDFILIQI